MTPDEKLAQLGSVWPGAEKVSGNVAPMQDVFARHLEFDEAIQHGIGHLTRPFGTRPVTADDGAQRLADMQRTLQTRTRLGIPALVHEECLTGFTSFQATVYPAAIAWAAGFNPDLVNEMASAIGRDMAALGIHQGLSPVVDVVRDYRWGRVEETLGEDPYLVSQLGSAYVRGLEDNGIIATLKHFAGYSASKGALNHGPVSIGPREFADYILPPFEHAIRYGKASSVMNSYSDIDGLPAGANPALLTDLLRGGWGFTGTVVSDYWAVAFLKTMHRIADTFGGAGAAALRAGIDIELPDTLGYGASLLGELTAGTIDEAHIDRALRRVLHQKLAVGLLDADWAPTPAAGVDLDSPTNRDIARRLAEQSIVLLDNRDRRLPLASGVKIAVIGPTADDAQAFFGCYSFPNHVLPSFPDHDLGIAADSLLTALRRELPDAAISYDPGCAVTGGDTSDIPSAAEAARAADIVVLAVGDRAGLFGRGTSGEGCDVPDLNLPGHQHLLVETILATGTPVVLVAITGRPYALGLYQDRTAAVVQSFFAGEEGGAAIAGVLTGRVNPSGKLPVGIPRQPGGMPHTYLAAPLGQNTAGISNLDPRPSYPFGHGLSYTDFAYRDLTVSDPEIGTDSAVTVTVTVANTGSRAGDEVVQLYTSDPVASVTRPTTQLVGFHRLTLAAGEAADVQFEVHTDRLSFTGPDLNRIVEPGEIIVRIGTAATDHLPPTSIALIGNVRTVNGARTMDTPSHQLKTETRTTAAS
jgi:beta-glucosidase